MEAPKQKTGKERVSKTARSSFSLADFTSGRNGNKHMNSTEGTINYYRIRRRIRESGLL